jgi:hypothetical protein
MTVRTLLIDVDAEGVTDCEIAYELNAYLDLFEIKIITVSGETPIAFERVRAFSRYTPPKTYEPATGPRYGWLITADHTWDHTESIPSRVGRMGPFNIPRHIGEALLAGQGRPFQLLTDDGDLVYEGRFATDGKYDWDGFEPLNDFGEGDAGCTIIKYWEGDCVNGSWVAY